LTRRFDLGCSFGVMQGRLSAQTDLGYQAFPWGTWETEFTLAAERGFEHVEWVLDSWQVQENPILNNPRAIKSRIEESGVRVLSICADYLMDRPLDVTDSESWTALHRLVETMQELEARWLVIPCVDQSSLRNPEARARFIAASRSIESLISGTNIEVSLETDLGPGDFADLLVQVEGGMFGVNYDIGNSASLGYNHNEEIAAYGNRVSLVHIKDRKLGAGSVFLGQGDADIVDVLGQLDTLNFNGPVTMQAFRDVQGINVLDQQLVWLEESLGKGN
jgi:L-ribulose-5-phosphate 3-epimerase